MAKKKAKKAKKVAKKKLKMEVNPMAQPAKKSVKKFKREERQFGLVSSNWSIGETILNQKKAYIINGGDEGFCLEKKKGLVEIEITIKEK